jgi:hypothetical protein
MASEGDISNAPFAGDANRDRVDRVSSGDISNVLLEGDANSEGADHVSSNVWFKKSKTCSI